MNGLKIKQKILSSEKELKGNFTRMSNKYAKGYLDAIDDALSYIRSVDASAFEGAESIDSIIIFLKSLKKSITRALNPSKIKSMKVIVVNGEEMIRKSDLLNMFDSEPSVDFVRGYNRAIQEVTHLISSVAE